MNPFKLNLEHIKQLALALVGNQAISPSNLENFANKLRGRMRKHGFDNLDRYVRFAKDDPTEFAFLISTITIHHTTWFREPVQLEFVKEYIRSNEATWRERPFRLLVAACASGEEAYSYALVLEELREELPGFDYHIEACDIDPISLAKAITGRYSKDQMASIPSRYRCFLETDEGQGWFRPEAKIRNKISFDIRNLLSRAPLSTSNQDIVSCRNVFIYLSTEQQRQVVKALHGLLPDDGLLMVGQSEAIDLDLGFVGIGKAIYRKAAGQLHVLPEAEDFTISLSKALERVVKRKRPQAILVGASTGGTEALPKALAQLPAETPPVVVVQHIPVEYRVAFTERLATQAGLKVGKVPGVLEPGHLYMAQGDEHIVLHLEGKTLAIKPSITDPEHGHRPAVDRLFRSAAELSGYHFLSILLTGMGADGAQGMLQLKEAGHFNLIQDELSSAVFGMPKKAMELGAAHYMGSLSSIRQVILAGCYGEIRKAS